MKRFLVALDGSPNEKRVLEAAEQLAQAQGAKLVLFHAVSLPTSLPPRLLSVPPDTVGGYLEEASTQHLHELARTLGPERLDGVHVELGAPWRAICDAANARQVDLIVIGSHGYGGVDRLLGTTAAKVVNHADRSVLVVR